MSVRFVLLLFLAGCGAGSVALKETGDSDGTTDSADTDVGETADSGETGESGESGETGETGDTGEPIVLTGSASVAANPDNPFSAVVTVTVDHDAEVWVDYGEGALDHTTNRVSATAGAPTEVVVLGLRADRDFTLRPAAAVGKASWAGEDLPFSTEPLAPGYPTCTPTFHVDEATFDRDEVVCTNASNGNGSQRFYLCTDYWGEPVHYMATPGNDSLMSMRHLRDGRWASTSYTTSKVAVFDAKSKQIEQYTPSWFDGKTRFAHEYFDNHEMYEIPFGEWQGAVAFLTNSYEWFDDGSYKLGNGLIVLDLDTEEVLYDYSFHGELGDGVAMDDMLPYERDGYGDYPEDWNHTNTVLYGEEEDGTPYFLLSLKSQDWIMKLHPQTDELVWALGFGGDFQLVDDIDAPSPVALAETEWAFHQHGVVFLERDGARSRLLMLDNGYPRQDERGYRWDLRYSRALELRIDEDSKLADIQWAYGSTNSRDDDYMFSSTCGNSELLAGEDRVLTLMGESKEMIEVSYPEGERRWDMTCTSSEWCEFRVRWAPDLYTMNWDER